MWARLRGIQTCLFCHGGNQIWCEYMTKKIIWRFQCQYRSRDIAVPSKFRCHIIQCHVPMPPNWSTDFAFISFSRHFRGRIRVRIAVFALCVRLAFATSSNCRGLYICKEKKIIYRKPALPKSRYGSWSCH